MGSSLTAGIVAAAGVERIGALVGQMGGEVTGEGGPMHTVLIRWPPATVESHGSYRFFYEETVSLHDTVHVEVGIVMGIDAC
jgi:hypothetical protein